MCSLKYGDISLRWTKKKQNIFLENPHIGMRSGTFLTILLNTLKI